MCLIHKELANLWTLKTLLYKSVEVGNKHQASKSHYNPEHFSSLLYRAKDDWEYCKKRNCKPDRTNPVLNIVVIFHTSLHQCPSAYCCFSGEIRYVFVIITSETYIDPCPRFNFIKGCIDGVVSLPEFPNAIATMPLQCHWLSEKNTISDQHPRYPPLGFLATILINSSSQCRSEMAEWPA